MERLAAEHDPEEDLRRRRAYLEWKRRSMPRLVRHQELLKQGLTLGEIVNLDYEQGGFGGRHQHS